MTEYIVNTLVFLFDLQRGDVYVKRYSVAVLLSGLSDNMHLTDNMHFSDNMRRTSIFTRRKSLVFYMFPQKNGAKGNIITVQMFGFSAPF